MLTIAGGIILAILFCFAFVFVIAFMRESAAIVLVIAIVAGVLFSLVWLADHTEAASLIGVFGVIALIVITLEAIGKKLNITLANLFASCALATMATILIVSNIATLSEAEIVWTLILITISIMFAIRKIVILSD